MRSFSPAQIKMKKPPTEKSSGTVLFYLGLLKIKNVFEFRHSSFFFQCALSQQMLLSTLPFFIFFPSSIFFLFLFSLLEEIFDKKILQFYGIWDMTSRENGDALRVRLHYHLSDNTIEGIMFLLLFR